MYSGSGVIPTPSRYQPRIEGVNNVFSVHFETSGVWSHFMSFSVILMSIKMSLHLLQSFK